MLLLEWGVGRSGAWGFDSGSGEWVGGRECGGGIQAVRRGALGEDLTSGEESLDQSESSEAQVEQVSQEEQASSAESGEEEWGLELRDGRLGTRD